jgi:hypothetical protein
VASGWRLAAYCRAAAAEARFDAITSVHIPSRVKMWEGMCSTCGTQGAMAA